MDLARIELDKGNYDKVVPYCLNVDEDNALALYYLARVEAYRKNSSRAIELYLKAIELDNDEHDFYLDLAKSYIDISWFDEALISLKKSINISIVKNNLKGIDEKYFLSGWILIKKNEPSKALLSLDSRKKESKLYRKAQILIQVINLKREI
jgi:tetratricopeptide (TPR) repeat protein